ncbi:418_t:CDS:1, partial [Acaulospora colombiana]
ERKTGKVEPKKSQTVEKLDAQIDKLASRIKETKLMMVDKDEGKTTALGTSKINYIDPRISAAWCLKHNVPTEKIFNKSLRDKFKWALDVVDADWVSLICSHFLMPCPRLTLDLTYCTTNRNSKLPFPTGFDKNNIEFGLGFNASYTNYFGVIIVRISG